MSIEAMRWAFRARVRPASAKLVLLALADHSDPDGRCFPGINRLAQYTSLDRDTVMVQGANLVEMGLVSRRPGRQGLWHYQLNLDKEGADQSEPPTSRNLRPVGTAGIDRSELEAKPVGGSDPNRKEPSRNHHRVSDALIAEGFERFRQLYPSRGSGDSMDWADAKKKYRLIVRAATDPVATIATLSVGAESYARRMRTTGQHGTQYVKQPRTWLNKECWQDEIEAEAQSPATPGKRSRANFDTDENLHNSPAWRAKRDAEEGRGRGNR